MPHAVARGSFVALVVLGGCGRLGFDEQTPLPAPQQRCEDIGLPSVDWPLVEEPSVHVAVADITGDGVPDLLALGGDSGELRAYRGQGDGTFELYARYPIGGEPSRIAVGHVDDDDRLDVVVTRAAADSYTVLLGRPTGGLAVGGTFPTGRRPIDAVIARVAGTVHIVIAVEDDNAIHAHARDAGGVWGARFVRGTGTSTTPASLAVADLDGDGLDDVIVGNRGGSGGLTVLLGRSDGLAPGVFVATGADTTSIVAGQLVGDESPDVAITTDTGKVMVLRGSATGALVAFGTYVPSPVKTPSGLAIVDADGDGDADLLVGDRAEGSHAVGVLHGSPTGFIAAPPLEALPQPAHVVVAALDDDVPDIVIGSATADTIAVLLAARPGELARPSRVASAHPPTAIASGDVDGDGTPDLVVASARDATLEILAGTSDGRFVAMHSPRATPSAPAAIAVGDVDGDDRADVIVALSTEHLVAIYLDGGVADVSLHAVGLEPVAIAVGDVDGDGAVDIAVANAAAGSISVLRGDGRGGFTRDSDLATGSTPSALAIADLDGDGAGDIVVVHQDGRVVRVRWPTRAQTATVLGLPLSAVATADLDGDGHAEVIAVSRARSVLHVLRVAGAALVAGPAVATGRAPAAIAVADIDGDGRPDLVTPSATHNTVTMLRGHGDAQFGERRDYGTGIEPAALAIIDANHDGAPDIVTANVLSSTVSVLVQRCLR